MKEFDSLHHKIIKKGEIDNSKLDETLLSLEKGKTYYYVYFSDPLRNVFIRQFNEHIYAAGNPYNALISVTRNKKTNKPIYRVITYTPNGKDINSDAEITQTDKHIHINLGFEYLGHFYLTTDVQEAKRLIRQECKKWNLTELYEPALKCLKAIYEDNTMFENYTKDIALYKLYNKIEKDNETD